MIRLFKIFTLLLATMLAGCATLGQPAEPPKVSLADIRLVDFGLIEQRFVLKLRIQNPNAFDIPLEGLAYTLQVNDMKFAEGVANAQTTIPRYGEAVIQTEAISNLGALLKQLETVPQEQAIRYRISGRVDVGGIRGLLPFTHDGEIALPASLTDAQRGT